MDNSIWLATASATFAGAGLMFSGYQTLLARNDRLAIRQVELAGVSISWVTKEVPDHAEPDGTAAWVFAITIDNPGRMPIDEVLGVLEFPIPVRRRRYSGKLEEPTRTISLYAPVIPGNGQRGWRRELVAPWARREDVYSMTGIVSFRDLDGRHRTNHWPRSSAPST